MAARYVEKIPRYNVIIIDMSQNCADTRLNLNYNDIAYCSMDPKFVCLEVSGGELFQLVLTKVGNSQKSHKAI